VETLEGYNKNCLWEGDLEMAVAIIDQQLFSSAIFPLAGGGLLGFCVGWAIKKIMKLAFIILGLFILVLGYLEYQRWISVTWHVVENQTQSFMNHAAHKVYAVTRQREIPIDVGVLGFVPGLAIGLTKG
jgi:uncharacterized membrane protein (Fun14 family)